MNKKTISRSLSIAVLLILPLSSCRGGETPPSMREPTGTDSETSMPLFSPTSVTPSPTSTLTATDTGTLTPTGNPVGYALKDWREPVKVITPENMDRVERIGQLEFVDSLERFAFSTDGSWMGVDLFGNTSIILDPFTFEKRWEIRPSYGFVAFSYDGQILETGGAQYDLTTGAPIGSGMTIAPFPGALMDVEFSPNGQYIVAAGTDHLSIYPMKAGIKWGVFGRDAEPWHASASPDSKLIAVNYWFEKFLEIWDPYLRQPVRILMMQDITGRGKPRFSKDGKSLFFTGNGTWEGQKVIFFQEWDYLSGKPLHVQMIPGEAWESGLSMDISPVSQLAALGTIDGSLYLFPFRDCRAILIGERQPEDTIHIRINIVAFRPDGKLLATLRSGDNKIEFWGILESGAGKETPGPTADATDAPVACPEIPMVAEHPTPKYDWWRQ